MHILFFWHDKRAESFCHGVLEGFHTSTSVVTVLSRDDTDEVLIETSWFILRDDLSHCKDKDEEIRQ